MSRVRILSIEVDKVTMGEAVDRCLGFIDEGTPHLVVTPNAEIAYNASKNLELVALINGADLVVADGIGVVMASRILGDPVPEKVGGVDLSTNLLKALNARKKGRVFLFGTHPEVVAEAARRIQQEYPDLTVAGYRDGFFKPEDESGIVAAIQEANADVLFVALGSPKQEQWLHKHLPSLGVKVGIGVGGTIDVWAGAKPRPPEWVLKAHLEWLYYIVRLGRVRRSLPPLMKFALAVVGKRMRGR